MIDSFEVRLIGFLFKSIVIVVVLLVIRVGVIRFLNYEKMRIRKWEKDSLIKRYKWGRDMAIFTALLFLVKFVVFPLIDFFETKINLYDTLIIVIPGCLVVCVFAWYGHKSSKIMKEEIESRTN